MHNNSNDEGALDLRINQNKKTNLLKDTIKKQQKPMSIEFTNTNQTEQLLSDVQKLNAQVREIQNNNIQLKNQNATLQYFTFTSNHQITELQTNVQKLKDQIIELQSNHFRLQDQNVELKNCILSLLCQQQTQNGTHQQKQIVKKPIPIRPKPSSKHNHPYPLSNEVKNPQKLEISINKATNHSKENKSIEPSRLLKERNSAVQKNIPSLEQDVSSDNKKQLCRELLPDKSLNQIKITNASGTTLKK
ncbi:MAG: hypothetical protein HRK26_03585 [Rickettsiaceae bacterium H1]|nr:hypothetical protein [Rickettsiaceae bacterium H1]